MKQTQSPGFFSVFLLSLMTVLEVLVMLGVWKLALLPDGWLLLIAGVLGLYTLLMGRMIFVKKPRWVKLKRFVACLLILCNAVACLGTAFGLVMVEETVDSMFGDMPPVTTHVPEDPNEESFIVYLGGSDTRSSKLTKSRNDVNILAVVNPNTKQLLLVNTPRDYYVSNPAGGGAKDKLAHIGLYGTDNCKQSLGELYGQPIAYAALINFKGFETLIDALGGITVHSDVAFRTTEGGYYIQAGENQLNGAKALAFARERSHLAGGDNTRGQNQMKVIAAMVQQMSGGNLLSRYRDILNSLEGMFATDMPLRTITELAAGELGNLAEWQIHSVAVTGHGGTDYNFSSGGNAYVMYPDADSVAHAKSMIEKVMNGEYLE